VVRWSASATHQGPMFGLPATGKTVQITGINIYRIDCGKIVESWSETNALDVLRELT
jgi:predicted ester cyclase